MTEPTPPDLPDDRRERAWPWWLALAAAGMLLTTLPHLIGLARSGDAGYIADGDGLLYLSWSRDIVRHGSLAMTDAIHRPSGPMMHPWVLFVPTALAAHVLGLGVTGLGVIWRLVGGAALALGLYAVFRPFTRTARGAAGLAAFLLFDVGLLFGQVVQRDFEILIALARGSDVYVNSVPRIMAHLRVPTPAMAIPFLLLHYALAHRARRLGTTGSAIAAGLSLGLLFHVFFYFATAAFLGTALAWLLDREGRRSYGLMLAVGALIAAPAVVAGAQIKGSTPPDWLHRTDKFVPVGRFDRSRLLLPKVLIAEWAAAGLLVWRSRRELIYLWCCTGAGLALANQQVVTGMDLENFHWTFAYGVAFSLLIALIVLPWLGRVRGWRWIGAGLVAFQVVVGTWLRGVETVATRETNEYRTFLETWRGEGFSLPEGAVVAGHPRLLLLLGAIDAVDPLTCRLVEFSSQATDEERDERVVLNVVLMGLAGPEAEAAIVDGDHVSEWSLGYRRALLDRIAADPVEFTDRFRVTHILVRSGHRPPTLEGRSALARTGRLYDLWRVEPTGDPGPGSY
jgi:hypothetical protein